MTVEVGAAGQTKQKAWEKPEVRQLMTQDAEATLTDNGVDGGVFS